MRIFRSAIAVLAVLGLATLSDFARGAGGPSANNVVPAETLVDVHAKSMKGASFIAPETGAYSFTIVSGALSYVSPKEVAISPLWRLVYVRPDLHQAGRLGTGQ